MATAARNRVVLFAVALVVVGLVVAGIVWSTRGGGSTDLPDKVGDWVAEDTKAYAESVGADQDRAELIIARARGANAYNSEQFSKAYDGAEVSTRSYLKTGDDASVRMQVVVIDEESGPVLPVAFTDPAQMGLAAPMDEVVRRDDVQCLVHRVNPPMADKAEAEDLEPDLVRCQRTGSSRTVRVTANGASLDDVVDFTNEIWDQ